MAQKRDIRGCCLYMCLFKYERLITQKHDRIILIIILIFCTHRACCLRVLFICQPRELGHIGGERMGLIKFELCSSNKQTQFLFKFERAWIFQKFVQLTATCECEVSNGHEF